MEYQVGQRRKKEDNMSMKMDCGCRKKSGGRGHSKRRRWNRHRRRNGRGITLNSRKSKPKMESKRRNKKITCIRIKIEENRRITSRSSHRTSIYSKIVRSKFHCPTLLTQVLPTSHWEWERKITLIIKDSNLRLYYLRRLLRVLGHLSNTKLEGLPAVIRNSYLYMPMKWFTGRMTQER